MKLYNEVKEELLRQVGGEEEADKLRELHPSKLSLKLWIWFHPSAYSLIYWGTPACLILQASVLAIIYYFFWSKSFFFFTAGIMLVLGLIISYIKVTNWNYRKGMTLYDVMLRNRGG